MNTYYWWLHTPSSTQVINVVTIKPDGAAYGRRGVYVGEVGVLPTITATFN